ncbi:hypothetical protein POM88_046145 [Heracleum sosnowskyi]|uniref:DUF4218 domain-containing protein n=1 Tax=Heracleum sosnowskyi TaxID=360622 RepID=A0AAD8H799_9APIA|nr:hypothetical protein POM88_046145 [Heracleum sosnowskyi]
MLQFVVKKTLKAEVALPLIRLSVFLRGLWSKVIDLEDLKKLQQEFVEVLCHFEMIFPQDFFDIMVHFLVHLVRDVELGGRVHLPNIFPIERRLLGRRIKNVKKMKLILGPQTHSRAIAASATEKEAAQAGTTTEKEVTSSFRAKTLKPTCSKLLKQASNSGACGTLSTYLDLRDRQKNGIPPPTTENVPGPNMENIIEEEIEAGISGGNKAHRDSITDTHTLGPNSMANVRENFSEIKKMIASCEDADELIANGKAHGREWLKGRHGKTEGLASTSAPADDPYLDDLTTKIRRELEAELEAKEFIGSNVDAPCNTGARPCC